MPVAAILLLGLLVVWLAVNFEKGPAYFFTISFIGLTNDIHTLSHGGFGPR